MNTEWAAYYGYSVGWATVRKMPEKRAYRLFDRMADRVWKRRGKSVLQYEKNIHRVLPDATPAELRDLSRQCMHSYARYWCDAFRMPDWSDERIRSLPVVGLEKLDKAYREDPVSPMFVTPHSGNYDYGAAFLASHFGSITTVAEQLRPKKLFDKFVGFRQSRGVEVIGAGTPGTMDVLEQRVLSKRLVGLVGERDLSRHGIPVEFFGQEARMPAGPAVLAQRTGATLFPVAFWYDGPQAKAELFDPIRIDPDLGVEEGITALTQAWADSLTVGIARHPGDWHMLQPLWTADLDPTRDPMRRANAAKDAAESISPPAAKPSDGRA